MLQKDLRQSIILFLSIILSISVLTTLGYFQNWAFVVQFAAFFRFGSYLVTAVYACLPILILGHFIVRKVLRCHFDESPAGSILIAWAMGWAVIILIGLLLLGIGLYSPLVWIVIAFIINLLSFFGVLRKRWQPLIHFKQNVLPEMREYVIGELTGPARLWNISILLLILVALLHTFIPPNSRDALAYHLVLPRLWEFQRHWFVNSDNYHLIFPANIEIIWGYALAVGGIHLPRLITLAFGILTIAWMRKWLKDSGFDSWVIGFCLFFFLFTPLIIVMIAFSDVEWPMIYFIFLGFWGARRYLETRERLFAILTGVCWGISVGTKYSAIPVVCFLGFEYVFSVIDKSSLRKSLSAFIVLIVGIFVFSGPWFFRNYILTNDPIYPLSQVLAIDSTVSDSVEQLDVRYLTRHEDLKGAWRWNQWLFYSTVGRFPDYYMHLGWPLLHYAVVLLGWKHWRNRPWLSVILLSILFFYFSPSPRIFFPILGLTWLFLPYYIQPFSLRRIFRAVFTGIILLFAASSFCMIIHCWFMSYNHASQYYLMGLIDDDDMLMKDGIVTPVMKWIRDQSPMDSRFWVWCEDKVFYFDRWTRSSSPYDYPSFLEILDTQGVQGLSSEINNDRINYVVVNTSRCSLPLKTVYMEKKTWQVSEGKSQELDEWMKCHLRLIGKDDRFELYQVNGIAPLIKPPET